MKSLAMRLFLSYLVVLVVGLIVLAVVAQFSLPGAYGRHLGMMEGMPGGLSGMMGRGAKDGLYQNFRSGFFEALAWAGLAAGVVAVVISIFVSRGLSAPIRAMTVASHRISEGRYSERVPTGGRDEVGQLAESFNRMAEKLEQTETMRRQLIGDVSHELRTPLTAIKGSMEGLMDNILPADAETFSQIHEEADRLSRLVDDLQELSRVESGTFSLDRKPVMVTDLVSFTLKRFSRQCEAKGVTLTADLPDSLPTVLVDEDRIGQVLLNLVGNALQYTSSGGQITISARALGREVKLSVTDTGIGIPPEHLPHIFDRFYRVDKSRSRQSGGGSGIGLTIAKHLVELHGGTIRAESEGAGSGSTFWFTLPVS
jgi:signal transduction histidine kinase